MNFCFISYPVYAIAYAISLLPYSVLSFFSMLAYGLGWKLFGYRKSVIIQNLAKTFPEKKYKEIDQIADKYSKHLSQLFAGWLKSLSESKSSALSRIAFENIELLERNEDIFIVMGHYGNWEILSALPAISSKPVYAVYKKQSSHLANFLNTKMRCRFGIKLLESKHAARFILKNKIPSIYILITDQSPSAQSKTKLQFMNQPTLVFESIERLTLAKKGCVVYVEIMPQKSQKYIVKFTTINSYTNKTQEVFSNLEQTIRENPQYFLWSHRRWKHAVSFVGLLCYSLVGFAQQVYISGTIADLKTGEPIEYATIVLYQQSDSLYKAGTLTDSLGHFFFKIDKGNYFIVVNHLNYERYYKIIQKDSINTDLGSLLLTPLVLNLGEVIVAGKILAVRLTDEKSIYNVSDMSGSQSSSIKELLKSIPSLTVDFNDNVLLNGVPVVFLIDGRNTTMSDLSVLSPIQIASIEVISNPTSKYDASGLSGIVQLITKKNKLSGISGLVQASGAKDTQTGSIALNYRKDKINLGSIFSIWKNYQHGSIETIVNYNSIFNQVKADIRNITGNINADYSFDSDNNLSLSYQYTNFGYLSKDTSDFRIGQTDMKGITHQISSNYTRKLSSKGESFKAAFYYNTTSPTTESDLKFTNDNILILNKNSNNSIIGTLDYHLPFTENANFETGLKTTTRNINIFRSDNISNNLSEDRFSMNESILSGYVLMNSRMDKFNFQFGIRGESNLAETSTGTHKWDLFPNLLLSFAANDNNQFYIGYNKRINRPSAADINPFVLLIDPTSRFQGNSDLMSEYSRNFFIDYINSYQSNKIKISGFYKRVNNLITKTYTTSDNGILYSPVNIPLAHFYGLDFSSTQNLSKELKLQPSAGISASYIPHNVSKQLRSVNSYYIGLTAWMKLPYDFDIQLLAKYTGRTLSVGSSSQSAIVQGLAIGRQQFLSEFSVSKSLLKNNLNVSMRVTDPLSLMKMGFSVYSKDSERKSVYHLDTRFVFISLSYRFNKHNTSKTNHDDGGIKVF